VVGKAYWIACGRPTVRSEREPVRAGSVMATDVPRCPVDADVDEARRALTNTAWPWCVVVNEQGVVAGRVDAGTLAGAPGDAVVVDVMETGPSTIRADADVADARQRMRKHKSEALIVTDPDGRLLGALRSVDADGADEASG
jgi:Mg/Co/Ni transporter MgtE